MPCPNCEDVEMTEARRGRGHTCGGCGYHEER